MRSPILSIVVPIYKVEPYLRKCVDSLLDQDLGPEEYEIILIDDGSPDNCGTIADKYAAKFDNIKVIHQENGGLSVARNTGIDSANGKYIQFVDSDDYLEPNVLGTLVARAEHDNLDVLRFNYRNVNENYEEFWPNKTPKQTWGYEESVVDGVTFLNERLGYACYAVQFLIRKNILDNCYFKAGIYFEDTEWTPRLLVKSTSVASLNITCYNYLVRKGSITRTVSPEKKEKLINDRLLLIDSLTEQSNCISNKKWHKEMISGIAVSLLCDASNYSLKRQNEIIRILRKKHVFPLLKSQHSRRANNKIAIINISPELFCLSLRLKKLL